MSALEDCLKLIKRGFEDDERAFLVNKSKEMQGAGATKKAADMEAVRLMAEKNKQALDQLHKQVGHEPKKTPAYVRSGDPTLKNLKVGGLPGDLIKMHDDIVNTQEFKKAQESNSKEYQAYVEATKEVQKVPLWRDAMVSLTNCILKGSNANL